MAMKMWPYSLWGVWVVLFVCYPGQRKLGVVLWATQWCMMMLNLFEFKEFFIAGIEMQLYVIYSRINVLKIVELDDGIYFVK